MVSGVLSFLDECKSLSGVPEKGFSGQSHRSWNGSVNKVTKQSCCVSLSSFFIFGRRREAADPDGGRYHKDADPKRNSK